MELKTKSRMSRLLGRQDAIGISITPRGLWGELLRFDPYPPTLLDAEQSIQLARTQAVAAFP